MACDMAIFVSKRLQRVAMALLCLMAVQGLVSLSGCEAELTPQASAARLIHLN